MGLRARLQGWEDSGSVFRRTVYWSTKGIWRAWQFARFPEIRWRHLTGWLHPNDYYQRSTYSEPNRYPDLFAACARHVRDVSAPMILSFGCATGEEVHALSQHIPHGQVVGVDINRWCIRKCRRMFARPGLTFWLVTDRRFKQSANFDAIFCLAVFQRSENRLPDTTVTVGLNFEKFERELQTLDAKLKPGGLLIVDHADFLFADTALSASYEALPFEGNCIIRERPLFDRSSRRISDQQKLFRAFIKRRG